MLGGRAAAGVLSLIYMVIAARALGPTDYGVLVLVHGYVVVIGAIIGFPGWHAVVRYGARALADHDEAGLIRLLRFTAAVELAAGAAAIIAAAALVPIIGPSLGWPLGVQALAIPYSLAVLGAVRTTPAGLLQLVRRFDLLAYHSAVAPAVRLVGAIMVAAAGWGLTGFLVAWLIAALAEWATLWAIAAVVARRRLRHSPLVGRPTNVASDTPGLWRFMLAANADVTFADLSARLAPLAIGWTLGPGPAGLFAIAQRATVVLAQPAQILGQAAYSELAKLVAQGDRSGALRRALLRCIAIALGSAVPILIILAFFSRDIAVLLGGGAFGDAAAVMIWLAAARTILLVAPPCSAGLIAMGRPALSVLANAGLGLALLPLLLPLTMRFGLVGAGMQALLQAAATSALLAGLVWRTSALPAGVAPLPAKRLEELEVASIEAAEAIDLS
ncbi:lipopolysaccharide biosynthesis protein [Sphingomonas sp. ID1715]|nr:lipopolysaccharide biosynthesis protein [Sphingomonas sp. ID1715]